VTNRGNDVIDIHESNENKTHLLGKYGDYDFNDIINTFKPKAFKIEYPLDSKSSNTISMFTSIKRCNDIKKDYENSHNIKYDIVVRSRFDLIFNNPMIISDVYPNTLYVKHRPGGCGGLNDWFAYGDYNVMDLYGNIISSIDDLGLKSNCAEGVIGNYVNRNGIKVQYLIDSFSIMRNDGNPVI